METRTQTIQKSYYQFCLNFIKEHIDILRQKKIFIFGAGIRGCNLLWILRSFHLSNICFVDNNINKQGTQLENCAILSFSEADKCMEDHVFLCPVENGKAILEQLKLSGSKENIDYYNLDFYFTDYLDLVEELKKPSTNYSLLFGCCVLSSYILKNDTLPPLGEVLKKYLFYEACKLCTLPGFYSTIYYYATRACLKIQRHPPHCVMILMEVSSLSPYEPLMMGVQNYQQHIQFMEKLTDMVPEDQEMKKYLCKVKERFERSKQGSSPVKANNTLEAQRQVYKLKYLYRLRETDESVVYTKRILEYMNEQGIPVILLFPPVDYQRGENVCGEKFKEQYLTVIKRMQSFLKCFDYQCIDASFIATSEFFVPPTNSPDINPFLNENGQKLLVEFLKEQDVLHPILDSQFKKGRVI